MMKCPKSDLFFLKKKSCQTSVSICYWPLKAVRGSSDSELLQIWIKPVKLVLKTKFAVRQAHESRRIILSTHACVRLSSGYSWAHTGDIKLHNCQLWTSPFVVFIWALSFLPSALCQLSLLLHFWHPPFIEVNFSRAQGWSLCLHADV